MTSKREVLRREQQKEVEARMAAREAAGESLERNEVTATALQLREHNESIYSKLSDAETTIQQLRDKLAGIDSPGAAITIDPALVDVVGFNRLFSSLDPESDPDFALFCENIRVFGGNKQPAMVRPSPASPGRYELVFGERRMRACQITKAPFTAVVSEMDDDELTLLRELENVGRKDKSLIERAFSLGALPERLGPGSRDELLAALKISRMTFHRLRTVAGVPLEIWTSIPQPHTTSVREAEAICDAYATNAAEVQARAKSMNPSLSHSDAVQHLSLTVPKPKNEDVRKPLTRKGKSVRLSINLPDVESAIRLTQRLEDVLLALGLEDATGLDKDETK